VAALALSRAPSLGWLTAAARPALLAVAALLAIRILALAARALRSRPVRAG
jgi:hypothetical protein